MAEEWENPVAKVAWISEEGEGLRARSGRRKVVDSEEMIEGSTGDDDDAVVGQQARSVSLDQAQGIVIGWKHVSVPLHQALSPFGFSSLTQFLVVLNISCGSLYKAERFPVPIDPIDLPLVVDVVSRSLSLCLHRSSYTRTHCTVDKKTTMFILHEDRNPVFLKIV